MLVAWIEAERPFIGPQRVEKMPSCEMQCIIDPLMLLWLIVPNFRLHLLPRGTMISLMGPGRILEHRGLARSRAITRFSSDIGIRWLAAETQCRDSMIPQPATLCMLQ